jgi:hypothetical protein
MTITLGRRSLRVSGFAFSDRHERSEAWCVVLITEWAKEHTFARRRSTMTVAYKGVKDVVAVTCCGSVACARARRKRIGGCS